MANRFKTTDIGKVNGFADLRRQTTPQQTIIKQAMTAKQITAISITTVKQKHSLSIFAIIILINIIYSKKCFVFFILVDG